MAPSCKAGSNRTSLTWIAKMPKLAFTWTATAGVRGLQFRTRRFPPKSRMDAWPNRSRNQIKGRRCIYRAASRQLLLRRRSSPADSRRRRRELPQADKRTGPARTWAMTPRTERIRSSPDPRPFFPFGKTSRSVSVVRSLPAGSFQLPEQIFFSNHVRGYFRKAPLDQ